MSFKKIKIPNQGNKITLNDDGSLNVPNNPIIPYIEGDGIGIDIWPSTEKVINEVVKDHMEGLNKIKNTKIENKIKVHKK